MDRPAQEPPRCPQCGEVLEGAEPSRDPMYHPECARERAARRLEGPGDGVVLMYPEGTTGPLTRD